MAADRLAAVGRALRDEFGVAVVVVGGPTREVEAVRTVASGVGGDVFPLAGKTSVAELAAVLERCQLVVGPTAVQCTWPSRSERQPFTLFGPADAGDLVRTAIRIWHVVVQSSRACAPCHRLDYPAERLSSHPCMSGIGTDKVVRASADLCVGRSLARARLA